MVSAASVAYRPIGLLGGMLAGAVAVAAFKAVWRKASHEDHLPTAMDGDLP